MAGRKSDFTLPTLDDLFSTQELRDDAKLSKIRDIPLELIDDFPDHPFKVRDDEDDNEEEKDGDLFAALFLLVATLIESAAEEILFRGYLQTGVAAKSSLKVTQRTEE